MILLRFSRYGDSAGFSQVSLWICNGMRIENSESSESVALISCSCQTRFYMHCETNDTAVVVSRMVYSPAEGHPSQN